MQPTSPAWAAPQGLLQLSCMPAWPGSWAANIPHHRQAEAAPARCPLTIVPLLSVSGKSWAAPQTFTCFMETPGQGLQRAVRQRSRAGAERQGRGVTSGDRQCPLACLDGLISGAHPGDSPALNSGDSRSQPSPAADPIPLLPHIWQQLLCQLVGVGGWRADVTGHLHVQLPHGRAASLHPTLHVWLMGSGI